MKITVNGSPKRRFWFELFYAILGPVTALLVLQKILYDQLPKGFRGFFKAMLPLVVFYLCAVYTGGAPYSFFWGVVFPTYYFQSFLYNYLVVSLLFKEASNEPCLSDRLEVYQKNNVYGVFRFEILRLKE